MAANIGQVVLRVFFRTRSPFSPQSRQETLHYFDEDNFPAFATNRIEPIPNPIGGIRVAEQVVNYDNFIQDNNDTYLEDGAIPAAVEEALAGLDKTLPTDAAAATRAALRARLGEISQEQREFFTWQVAQNLFRPGNAGKQAQQPEAEIIDPEGTGELTPAQEEELANANPAPRNFNEGSQNDNSPEWTYMVKHRPATNTKALFLTPFMKKNAPDECRPVHWGAKMITALALNQPFQIIYYFTKREPAVAERADELTPRFRFLDAQNKEMTELNLTKSIYFAIEIGISSEYHALLLFKNGEEPMFFRIKKGQGQTFDAFLFGKFSGFNSKKIFDENHKFFTVSVEPVATNLVVKSNTFGDQPWLIFGNDITPNFVGHGPLAVYGGNVQAGFAMQPIQYYSEGTVTTPETTFTVMGDSPGPTCSTALKGAGEIEQDRSYDDAVTVRSGEEAPKVHAVDAEKVDGRSIKGIVSFNTQKATQDTTVKRIVNTKLVQVDDPNVDPESQSGFGSDVVIDKTYQSSLQLISGDMQQGNGYVVERGRSPYVWRLTCAVPPGKGPEPADQFEASCDVMSVDLNWNATSYNEIVQSGTIKVLNRRLPTPQDPHNRIAGQNALPPVDYRQFTNRAVYVRIEAYWGPDGQPHAGHDPGPGNRQIFEGLTVGATVETVAEKETVTFKVEDYMNALQGTKFVLSPAYDGMKGPIAVRDMVQQTGLPQNRIFRNSKPMSSANLSGNEFDIPPVNINEKPRWRFRDGTSIKEGVLKIAQKDFKTIYFDQKGNFHYDDVPGGVFADEDLGNPTKFWSSIRASNAAGEGDALARQVWNFVSFSRNINDVYNAISVKSVDKKTRGLLAVGDAYWPGIADPQAEGYLGYRKHLVVEDAAFGDVSATFRYLDNYRRRVFIPPLTARFSTYGYSGLKPLDIIQLDGNYLRIMNIQMKLSASDNNYWMDVEGEWFFHVGKGEDPMFFEDAVNEAGSSTDIDPNGTGELTPGEASALTQ